MNYADLDATKRDALTAIVALDARTEPTIDDLHDFYERHFGPISPHTLSATVLPALRDASLVVQQRSESDGRVRINRPTEAGHELVHQTLRERQRWILPPEPRPDHDDQATLPEVLAT